MCYIFLVNEQASALFFVYQQECHLRQILMRVGVRQADQCIQNFLISQNIGVKMIFLSCNRLTSRLVVVMGIVLFSSTAMATDSDIMRGKYLIEIGGCNDCHTAGYAPSGGAVQEEQWLLGDALGFRGGWGTTYPPNLRTYMNKLSEKEWLSKAKTLKTRPPMPWWVLNRMTQEDLSAVYAYITQLPVVESNVPEYVAPGEQPKGPYIQWPAPPK